MTVTEKLAHAAERKAFETMLDSLIRKSRTQDVGKVADDLVSMVQRIHSSVCCASATRIFSGPS